MSWPVGIFIGSSNPKWKGGIRKNNGYLMIYKPEHLRTDPKGYVMEHVLVVEKVLGKYLPYNSVPHHNNEIRSDNRPENLVLCHNNSYHLELHRRKRIVDKGGNPNTEQYCGKCETIKKIDDFSPSRQKKGGYCRTCNNQFMRERRDNNVNGS